MKKLCPKCYYFGKGKFNNFIYGRFFSSLFLGILFVALGIYNLFKYNELIFFGPGLNFSLYLQIYFITLLPFVLGIINIVNYFRGGSTCPTCNYKPMLPLDDPEAIKLIKQYDLQPGVNNVVQNEQESDQTKSPTT